MPQRRLSSGGNPSPLKRQPTSEAVLRRAESELAKAEDFIKGV